MKINKLFIASFISIFLLSSCRRQETSIKVEDPKMMNPWEKFDSVEYANELHWRDSLWQIGKRNFVCIEKTDYLDNTYRQVIQKRGEPEFAEEKELEYGFERYGPSKDWYWFGVTMYVSSEGAFAESQRCYHCAKILNTPKSKIIEAIWRDSLSYAELYFLIKGQDTIAFDGFQARPDFQWLP